MYQQHSSYSRARTPISNTNNNNNNNDNNNNNNNNNKTRNHRCYGLIFSERKFHLIQAHSIESYFK